MANRLYDLDLSGGDGNPVHRQIDDIARRLSGEEAGSGDAAGRTTPAAACLLPLLEALGWAGVERHVFEAMPHSEPVETLHDLRSVMVRLNFNSKRLSGTLDKVVADQFPCLLSVGEEVHVCIRREADGSVRAFRGSTGETVLLPPAAQRSGEVYVFTPFDTGEFRHAVNKYGWFLVSFRRLGRTLLSILAVGLVLNILALALPIFIMNVYDKAIGAKAPDVLVTLCIGMAVVLVADLGLKAIKGTLQAYFGARLDTVVGNTAMSHLLYMPLSMTGAAPVGAQIARLKQFESVRDVFIGPLANALIDLPFSLVFIGAIAIIGGPLSLLPLGLLFVYIAMAMVVMPWIRRSIASSGEAKSRLQNLTIDSLGQQRTIRHLNAEVAWIERYRNLSADFAYKNLKTRQIANAVQVISQTIMSLCGISVLGIGAIRVLDGDMSHGALIAVMALSWRVLNPMNQAFLGITRLGQVRQMIDQLNGLMRLPIEREPGELPAVQRSFQGTITISGLFLRYNGRTEPALKGVDLVAEKGRILAVTGPSGSGKSSLLLAILGVYPAQGGAVLADGLDVRQLNCGEWRQSVGYAPEQPEFFYGTVAQNLRLADPKASDERVRAIAEEFRLLDYADILPEGLETRLTGSLLRRMPGTVKQRILLARTFLKDCPVYLLDNPGNNLDFEADRLLMDKIVSLREKATVILVTHRPSHMRLADEVVYLRYGRILAKGPPEEILPKIVNAA